MAASGPVPSKAALHALRGIIFGTSCSLVLLAEERRRRISIARSAVENGRKLKSLKCYSSAGSAALEAIREDTNADAHFINSSAAATRETRRNIRWFWDKLDFDDADINETPPDPRRPRRTDRNEQAAGNRASSLASRTSATRESQARRQLLTSSQRSNHVAAALRDFLASSSATSSSVTAMEALQEFGMGLQHEQEILQATNAALRLFLRACDDARKGLPVPSWLCELSQHLCRACQREGDFSTAAEILSVLLSHGPITLEAYLAHTPEKLISRLCSTQSIDHSNFDLAIRQLRMAARLFLANVANDPGHGFRAKRSWSNIARGKIILNMIRLGIPDEALSTLRQLHQVCQFGFGTYAQIVRFFYRAGQFQQSLDAFVDLSKFGSAAHDRLISGRLIEWMFEALEHTDYHAKIDVLNTMHILRVEPNDSLDLRVAAQMLWVHWNKSGSLDQVHFLYSRVIGLLGTDVRRIYAGKTYKFHSVMIQIFLVAGERHKAHAVFQELQRQRSTAARDGKLIRCFALSHARSGNWQAARQVIRGMHGFSPLSERELEQYNEAWQQVFIEYSKTHTSGELEEFIEESVRLHEAPLLQSTIDDMVRRHGKRQSYKSLQSWMRFCQTRGFVPTKYFWLSILSSARDEWGYRTPQLRALFDELKIFVYDPADCADLEEIIGQSTMKMTTIHVRRRVKPSQEAVLYDKMRRDTRLRRWEHVLGAYGDAVNHGMGFSSRCLQLGVLSCIHTKGRREAQKMVDRAKSDGHDITKASIPLDLARLEDIQDRLQSRPDHANDSEDRPRAYIPIQRLFTTIRDSGRPILNVVFHKAAKVCLSVRNYREAINICYEAAETNGGGDLCFSGHSFVILSQAFAAQHEYGKLRMLLKQMLQKNWRTHKLCRDSLQQTIYYLNRASQSDKEDALIASDVQMRNYVEDVLRSVTRDQANILAQVDSLYDGASESDADDY